jgi:predicted transcriptional regulator
MSAAESRAEAGGILRSVREELGLETSDVAAVCGVDAGDIEAFERGEKPPPVWVFRALAENLCPNSAHLIQGLLAED